MPDIDSLSIQITSSSTKAVNAIDKIINSLNSLNTTLAATATASGLATLTNSLTTISKITIPAANFEGITKLSNALAKLGASQGATTVLPQIGNAFNEMLTGISAAPAVNENVTQLASALGRLGGTNAQRAVTTIPQLSTAFNNMIVELSNAPTVSRNIIELANAIAQLSRSGREAATSTTGLTGAFRNFNFNAGTLINPLRRLRLGFGSIVAIAGHVYANFFLLIRGARLLGKAIDYSSSMTEAANVVSVTFGKSADVVTEFTETCIKEFGLAKLSATQFASRFQAMGKTMGITSEQVVKANDFIREKISGNTRAYEDLGDSVADVSINLTKLTADIASLYNQDYEDVAKDMQSIYTGMTRPLRKYGLDLTNATLKEWAMSEGLNSNIEKMTQAEKTMLRYQYVMSRTAGAMGDFQKTADTWANSLRTVKQLLQEIARVIGEALINALKPALIAFRQFLTNFLDLTQKALNALGKLLGWRQIDFGGASLVEDMEDYADAIDDAAGAAKKLKGQLRGIDELNNLTTNPKGSGSGGGVSGLAADIESIWDQIKDTDNPYLSDVESWKEFGQRIADKIGEGLSSVNWHEVYTKASNFGKNFAEFLNGLIKPKTWELFGKTLAGGVMTAIETAFAFGSNFDWDNLGESIAAGINGFFKEFDGGKLADTIDTFIQGFERTFKKAVKGIHWDDIFADMIDFLTHIDLKSVDITIKAIGTVAGAYLIGQALIAYLTANPIVLPIAAVTVVGGFKLGEWIGEQWEEALGTNPDTGESRWYEWWETEFDFYFKAWEKAKKLWQGENNPYMLVSKSIALISFGGIGGFGGKSIAEKIFDAFEDKNHISIGDLWKKVFDGQDIADTILNSDAYKISDAIAEVFTIGLGDWGDDSPGKKALDWLLEKLSKLEEHIPNIEAAVGVLTTTPEMLDFMDNMSVLLGQIVAFGDPANVTGINNVGDAFGLLGIDIDDLKEKFNDFTKDAKEKWEEITKFFNEEISKWIEEDVKPFFDKDTWLGYLKGIEEAFEQIWKNPLQSAKDFFGQMGTDAEDFINGLIDGFKEVATAKGSVTGSIINFTANHIKIKKFADGGYPQMGSLFWAGEQGAELVGSINGNTAVASNGEITGITQAIMSTADSEIMLLRQQNELLSAILNKEFGISEDALFSSVRRSALDFTRSTGSPAFD